LIDQGRLKVDNQLTIPNQNLGIYQDPLPQHQVNTIASQIHQNQVTYKGFKYTSTFVAMVSITIRAQRVQVRQADIPKNQTNDGIIQPNIPRP